MELVHLEADWLPSHFTEELEAWLRERHVPRMLLEVQRHELPIVCCFVALRRKDWPERSPVGPGWLLLELRVVNERDGSLVSEELAYAVYLARDEVWRLQHGKLADPLGRLGRRASCRRWWHRQTS